MSKVKISWTGIGLEDWIYNSSTNTVIIPAVLKRIGLNKHDMFSVLHELGHAHYKHTNDDDIIDTETEAWDYAISCLKYPYNEGCKVMADYYIQQYKELQ